MMAGVDSGSWLDDDCAVGTFGTWVPTLAVPSKVRTSNAARIDPRAYMMYQVSVDRPLLLKLASSYINCISRRHLMLH